MLYHGCWGYKTEMTDGGVEGEDEEREEANPEEKTEIIIDTFPQIKKCEKRIKRKIKQEKSKN